MRARSSCLVEAITVGGLSQWTRLREHMLQPNEAGCGTLQKPETVTIEMSVVFVGARVES